MKLPNVPFDTYKAIPAVNQSALKQFKRSAKHGKHYLDNGRKETEEMCIGSLVHEQILTPHVGVLSKYIQRPPGANFTQKVWKDWKVTQTSLGKIIIETSEMELILGALQRIMAHDYARKLFHHGESELSLTATLEGVECKCRLDHQIENTIADIKTLEDAREHAFAKAIVNFDYHLQAAFYLDIARANDIPAECFVFVAIEKEPPYELICHQLDQQSIEIGRQEYRRLLALYRHCVEHREWPGYDQKLHPISLPPWKHAQAALANAQDIAAAPVEEAGLPISQSEQDRIDFWQSGW